MADVQLPSSTYNPVQARRRDICNTIIEDAPQVSVRRAPPMPLPTKASVASPMSDNFPTPKAVPPTASSMSTLCFPVEDRPTSPASSDTQSDGSSMWSKRSSGTDFDEMYDLSSSESEDVPLKLSSSVKKRVANMKIRPTSVAIPSPSEWPTVQKLQSTTPLSPLHQVQLSPAILEQFRKQTSRVPSTSSAPSLDGSLASDELTLSSCPSTPDVSNRDNAENPWEAPVQLNPSAFSVLQHISGEEEQQQETVIEVEVSEEAASEMREMVESPNRFGGLQIQTNALIPTNANETEDELSALSVPSPHVFFSSLNTSVACRTWSGPEPPNTSTAAEFYGVPFKKPDEHSSLPTSTAASFYGVPWQDRPGDVVEHTISVASPSSEKKDPITARRTVFTPTETIVEVDEIDETYHDTLKQSAEANMDRTQLWLSTQKEYLDSVLAEDDDSIVDSFKDLDGAQPKTPDQKSSPACDISPSSKKSVRFAPSVSQAEEKKEKRISPIHDGTFWQGFSHAKRSRRARDAFQHRQMRAEALQVRRNSLGRAHAEQLKGHFELVLRSQPVAPSPFCGGPAPGPEDEKKKEAIASAERERQAVQQMQPSAWHLEAQKELNGGTLLTSPVVATFKIRNDVKILDLAGQAHCGWSWDVAITHPKATVYTTVGSDLEAHIAESSLEGPNNHSVVAAPKLWELPFENDTFDVVSARNLYMHLKALVPNGEAADEWDLTLKECMRVLKPGGYLEFDLLDAELVHPEAATQALGVEFAVSLKTRGYDPCSGKNFLPRLKRAGFTNIKRAWMVLPVADIAPRAFESSKTQNANCLASAGLDTPECFGPPVTGSTKDVRAITGLVGARAWEQWMLKLNSEMGRSEERCLEGVAKALEESGRVNAGWRSLVGWSQKAN